MANNWTTHTDSTFRGDLTNQFKQAAQNVKQFQVGWGNTSTGTTHRRRKQEPDGPLDWLDGRVEEVRKQGREALAL